LPPFSGSEQVRRVRRRHAQNLVTTITCHHGFRTCGFRFLEQMPKGWRKRERGGPGVKRGQVEGKFKQAMAVQVVAQIGKRLGKVQFARNTSLNRLLFRRVRKTDREGHRRTPTAFGGNVAGFAGYGDRIEPAAQKYARVPPAALHDMLD
jgi:hypothetical protein